MRMFRPREVRGMQVRTWVLLVLLIGTATGCTTSGGSSLDTRAAPSIAYRGDTGVLCVRLVDGTCLTFRHVPASVYADASRHGDVMTYLHTFVLRGHLVDWEEAGETVPPSPDGRIARYREGDAAWQR